MPPPLGNFLSRRTTVILITLAAVGHVLAKVAVCLVGAVALYIAIFMYESEQGKLQDRIVKLWSDIDDRRNKGEPLALATKSAGLIGRLVDRVLGKRLISFRMVGMSTALSLFAGLFAIFAFSHLAGESSTWFDAADTYALIACLLSLISIGFALRKPASRVATLVLLAPLVFSIYFFVRLDRENLWADVIALILSTLCDVG